MRLPAAHLALAPVHHRAHALGPRLHRRRQRLLLRQLARAELRHVCVCVWGGGGMGATISPALLGPLHKVWSVAFQGNVFQGNVFQG